MEDCDGSNSASGAERPNQMLFSASGYFFFALQKQVSKMAVHPENMESFESFEDYLMCLWHRSGISENRLETTSYEASDCDSPGV